MKNLPPPPAEVWHVRQFFEISGSICSCGFWVYNSGSIAPAVGDLEAFSADWIFYVVPVLNAVTANDTSCGVFQVQTFGASPAQWTSKPPPNYGTEGSSTAPLNSAACISWITNDVGGSHARTLLPLPLYYVDADAKHITDTAAASLSVHALDLLAGVRSIPAIDLSACSLINLRRQDGGAPLSSSQVSLILGGNPDLLVATCRRRVRPA